MINIYPKACCYPRLSPSAILPILIIPHPSPSLSIPLLTLNNRIRSRPGPHNPQPRHMMRTKGQVRTIQHAPDFVRRHGPACGVQDVG